jgi:hypothetical protein
VPIVVEGETAADDDNGLKTKDSEKKVIAQFWGKELQGWTEAKPKS